MQPYFDPIKKTTSKIFENGRQPHFFFEKLRQWGSSLPGLRTLDPLLAPPSTLAVVLNKTPNNNNKRNNISKLICILSNNTVALKCFPSKIPLCHSLGREYGMFFHPASYIHKQKRLVW
jgi:hypothetical protein